MQSKERQKAGFENDAAGMAEDRRHRLPGEVVGCHANPVGQRPVRGHHLTEFVDQDEPAGRIVKQVAGRRRLAIRRHSEETPLGSDNLFRRAEMRTVAHRVKHDQRTDWDHIANVSRQ